MAVLSGVIDRFRKGGAQPRVTITSINMRWRGTTHSREGMVLKSRSFSISIPFQNKTSDAALRFDALKERFKSQEEPPVKIRSIEVSDPFKLLSVEPAPPAEIKSGQKVDFVINVEAPDYGYSGPMTVSFDADDSGFVKVQVNKVILSSKGKRVEIENSGVILNMPRGGVFKNSVQMYKALSYGDEVSRVTVSKPFEFVSSDPKLPFRIDDKGSYIATFYIKCPDVDYAGPMEIEVS
jgi:hypothetical protein